MVAIGRWGKVLAVVREIGAPKSVGKQLGLGYGWDNDTALRWLQNTSDWLSFWAMPAYVGVYTLKLALCLPYVVVLGRASIIFGFILVVLWVFSAKVLGTSLPVFSY